MPFTDNVLTGGVLVRDSSSMTGLGRKQPFVLLRGGNQWWRSGSTRQVDLPRICLQLILAYDFFRFVS